MLSQFSLETGAVNQLTEKPVSKVTDLKPKKVANMPAQSIT